MGPWSLNCASTRAALNLFAVHTQFSFKDSLYFLSVYRLEIAFLQVQLIRPESNICSMAVPILEYSLMTRSPMPLFLEDVPILRKKSVPVF